MRPTQLAKGHHIHSACVCEPLCVCVSMPCVCVCGCMLYNFVLSDAMLNIMSSDSSSSSSTSVRSPSQWKCPRQMQQALTKTHYPTHKWQPSPSSTSTFLFLIISLCRHLLRTRIGPPCLRFGVGCEWFVINGCAKEKVNLERGKERERGKGSWGLEAVTQMSRAIRGKQQLRDALFVFASNRCDVGPPPRHHSPCPTPTRVLCTDAT